MPRVTPELLVDTTDPARAEALEQRLADVVAALHVHARTATDAVVRQFSEDEPPIAELDDAAQDLVVSALVAHEDGSVTIHLDDTCGEHFLDGYWPAVRFGPDDAVVAVTVEA